MQYKLIAMDIDGTLIPRGKTEAPAKVMQALAEVKKTGTAVVVATGRSLFAVQNCIRTKLKPDYIICGNGTHVVNRAGTTVYRENMILEEMYALTDFCEDYDCPLCFCYEDGYYAYVGYEDMADFYGKATGHREHIVDGEDQDRHLQSMPTAAFCSMSNEQKAGFEEKYGHLGLRFLQYAPGRYDIVRQNTDKAAALQNLLDYLKLSPNEVIAVGDNMNDLGMLKLAGLGVCVEDGKPAVKEAADIIIPPCTEGGVAELCMELLS